MSAIEKAGRFQARRPQGQTHGLWRDELSGRRFRAAEELRRSDRGAAPGGRLRRRSHRHLRLLRAACDQPDHPRGAAPLPEGAVIVTKLAAKRGPDGAWLPALSPAELTRLSKIIFAISASTCWRWSTSAACTGIQAPAEGSIEAPLSVLADCCGRDELNIWA